MLPVINIMLEAKCVFRHYLEDLELEFLPCRLTGITQQMGCLQIGIKVFMEQIKDTMNIVSFPPLLLQSRTIEHFVLCPPLIPPFVKHNSQLQK